MQAVDVYLMYCALKAHFGKGDYDFVKYGGKSSATKDSFWKRTDRLFFVKTQRKYKKKQVIQDYLVSNFVRNTKGWLGDFNDENYIEWKKRTQSMSYNFKQELEKIGKVNILGVKNKKRILHFGCLGLFLSQGPNGVAALPRSSIWTRRRRREKMYYTIYIYMYTRVCVCVCVCVCV